MPGMFRSSPVQTLTAILLPIAFSQTPAGPKCYREPANLASIIEEFQSGITHESMDNLPGQELGFPIGPDDIDPSFVHIQGIPYDGITECPLRPNASSPDLNPRSTCPFRWIINVDVNRIPRDVAEVECSCEHCLEFAPDGPQTSNICEPVYYHIEALRRVGCDGEFYQYARVQEKIKIACICAHPHVQTSAGSGSNGPTPSP